MSDSSSIKNFNTRDPIVSALTPVVSHLYLLKVYGLKIFSSDDLEQSDKVLNNVISSDKPHWMIDFNLLRRGVANAIVISYKRESNIVRKDRRDLQSYESIISATEKQVKALNVAHRIMQDHFESVSLSLIHQANTARESNEAFLLLQKAHDLRDEYFQTANSDTVVAYLEEFQSLKHQKKFQLFTSRQAADTKLRKATELEDELLLKLELFLLLNF